MTRSEDRKELVPEPRAWAETHKSLALKALVQELQGDPQYHLLDLGPSFGLNVEFLASFCRKIRIEDLYSTLDSARFFARTDESTDDQLAEDAPSEEISFEKLLPFPEGTTFDIILGWNLLDYLRRREIQALVRHLNRFCRTGTYLLALSSTLRDIPSKPTSFRILDEETLVYLVESVGTRPSPRYTPRDFTSMMTGFRVHNSFLLKHGMQEYLFVHQ